jgi:2-polyprenyl-3-methyl-5-hydroxy-6-metoxy-1,4-benzoquinol methylase
VSDAPDSSRRPRLRSIGSHDLIERLNATWRISGAEGSSSIKQRLAAPLRRFIARLLATQESFNASVVQYVNTDQERFDAIDATLDRLDTAGHDREMLAARERRIDAAMMAMRAEHEELRTSIGVLQRAARSLTSPQVSVATNAQLPAAPVPSHSLGHRYVGFEDQFRGLPDTIRQNLSSYLPLFAGATDVLDIGCGRGEFLELLREQGVTARGIDLNDSMVEVCRAHGLQADTADAVAYLHAQPDESLGGLFAAQVVEHLEPAYLTSLIDAAFAKLRPGSPIVFETINPACWFAFFESYVRDITHVRPLHPDTLKFLLVAAGFQRLEIQYRAPYPDHEKLQPVHGLPIDAAEALNANAAKLNSLLFTHLDYAAIAYRP